jgi:thiosulfate/3-mercaptopyruvate sulfurtransferase
MKNFHSCAVLLLTVLMTTLLAGCGGNSGGETTPAPAQTGDTTLFPHAELLVSPTDVDTSQAIVIDARRSDAEYNAGHIPGAIFAPPSLFEKDGVLLPDNDLASILGNLGITRTSKIIIYDNTTASRGATGRLFWILEYLGCTDVRMLNGGWDQWKEYYVGTTEPTTLTAAEFTAVINPNVKYVTKEFVAEHFLPDPAAGYILVDVRTDDEYQGSQLEPRSGHIPGAINFPYSKCFNSDKTVLNFKDFKLLLETHGITLDKELVAYSTVGHRSGFFYFLCRLMGYENMSNYVGSIEDWAKSEPTLYPMKLGTEP